MAQHGYLPDYDESGYRGEDRERGNRYERDFMFRGRDREDRPEANRFPEEDREWRSSAPQDRFGGRAENAERFSSRQDDHYRSWRQRQIEALDREYEDYCREREQQFHRDFDSWRNDRRNQGSNEAEAVEGELQLTQDRAISGQGNTPSPIGQATLGTNNSENANPGPGKPKP